MLGCLLRGLGDDRHVQSPADCLSDFSQRHALFRDRVIPCARSTLLQCQPVETGSIEHVHRGPAVTPLPDICRDTFLAS